MLIKSFSDSVSRRVRTTCLAISLRTPVIDPDVSTRIIMSLALEAACRYQGRRRQSYKSGSHSPCPHFVAGNRSKMREWENKCLIELLFNLEIGAWNRLNCQRIAKSMKDRIRNWWWRFFPTVLTRWFHSSLRVLKITIKNVKIQNL